MVKVEASNTLALASNQNTLHVMCHLPRFHQGGVRSMPLRMIGIMPRWAALPVIALSTSRAVQDNLVRQGLVQRWEDWPYYLDFINDEGSYQLPLQAECSRK